jgi:uncharacterized protein with ACT and thioredoxin-like domain
LLNQLTSILSTENTNIRSLEARTDAEHGDGAIIEMTVEVRDKKQLEKLILAMRRISGVRDVERLLKLDHGGNPLYRSRTYLDLEIERCQDRLEGRPDQ